MTVTGETLKAGGSAKKGGCRLCPRNCGAKREMEETGVCGQTDMVKVARAALHYWEEPCISGEAGSGTVFFSGCEIGRAHV